MIVYFRNSSLKLNPREVRSTKRAVTNFINHVKKLSKNELAPTYYFTLLMMMHIMSQELLNDMDEETLAYIMNRLNAKVDD